MDTRLLSPSDLPCVRAPGTDTHHFVPVNHRMTCTYCHQTERQVRNAVPLLHVAQPCQCTDCVRSGDRRCLHCHLDMSVHQQVMRP